MEIRSLINSLTEEMIEIRHQIHAYPELAHEEINTASIVAATLKKYGYTVTEHIAGTGVSAILDCGLPGKTVALRADMDALPIQEETQLSFKSNINGKMHACGHDGHTATLLLVAAALSQIKIRFPGKIKFIFQMAEETGTGALAMIDAGILDNPKVDAIFGYHNTPKSGEGIFRIKKGCIHAAQDVFTIKIHGKGGHAAHPQLCIDPIYIGTLIVQALQGIVSRLTTPTEPVVLSVTQFHAGSTHNVIPTTALLNGTVRTINPDIRTHVKEILVNISNSIANTYDAKAEVEYSYCFAPTINHDAETELAIKTAIQVLGSEKVQPLSEPSMGSEDFSYYLEKVAGCFFWVGMGVEHLGIHKSDYEFNDKILPIAAEVLAQIALNYLANTK